MRDPEQQGRLVALTIVGGLFGAVAWWALAGKRTSYLDRYRGVELDPVPDLEPVAAATPESAPTPAVKVTQIVADPDSYFKEAG